MQPWFPGLDFFLWLLRSVGKSRTLCRWKFLRYRLGLGDWWIFSPLLGSPAHMWHVTTLVTIVTAVILLSQFRFASLVIPCFDLDPAVPMFLLFNQLQLGLGLENIQPPFLTAHLAPPIRKCPFTQTHTDGKSKCKRISILYKIGRDLLILKTNRSSYSTERDLIIP